MTNAEVVKSLKNIRNLYPWGEDSCKTLDYAIRAVTELPKRRKEVKRWRNKAHQMPCEDAISRQAVLKQLKGCLLGGETEYQFVKLHIDNIPPVNPQEPKAGYISIDDVMSVFDDFMCGEVDEDGTETFLEMLKDKAESEG